MRFLCDQCNAQYNISDEKVGSRGVKVRCKKCGHSIVVKKELASSEAQPEAGQATQIWRNPLIDAASDNEVTRVSGAALEAPEALRNINEDDVGAALDQALKSAPSMVAMEGSHEDHEATRIMNVESVRQLAEAKASSSSETRAKASDAEWFVAISDKQVGPLGLNRLKAMLERGEIGPDSLCWRAGFDDWLPMSEISELSAELSPRPTRPVIVATPSGLNASPASSSTSDWNSPRSTQGGGREVTSQTSAPERTVAEWRPSAASALASLVREEVNALAHKPATAGVQEPAPVVGASAPVSVSSHSPAGVASMASVPLNAGPMYGGASAYGYGMTPTPRNRGVVMGLVAVGAVVVLLVVVVLLLALRQPVIVQQPVPVAQTAPVTAVDSEKAAAPNKNVETEKVEPTSPPPPAAEPVAQAQPVKSIPDSVKSPPAPVSSNTRRDPPRNAPPKPERTKNEVLPPTPKPGVETSGDDFDSMFGGSGSSQASKSKTPTTSRPPSVYVPPAPGSGSEVQERLGQADIMQVVLSQRPALARCVDEQRKRSPDVEGTLVMQWTVGTNGRTSNVKVVSQEFKSTYLATCVGSLVKGWTFPKHRVQGEPVQFPFKF